MTNLDIAFLEHIVRLDALLRTSGWNIQRNTFYAVMGHIEALDDNGYDTIVSALLTSANTSRHKLFLSPYYTGYMDFKESERL